MLMRKKGASRTYSTAKDFAFVTGEVPYLAKTEAKELATRDCPGEDGERVYFPDRLPLAAYDLEVEFKMYGPAMSVFKYYNMFRQYLTGEDGTGTEIEIYSPYCNVGRRGVHMKSMGDPTFRKDADGEEFMSLEVIFHVTDPTTHIKLTEES